MKFYATVGGEEVPAERTADGVRVGERTIAFDAEVFGPGEAHLALEGRGVHVAATRTPGGWRIWLGGREILVSLEGERARTIRELTGGDGAVASTDLRAPMPGLVVKVLVESGQSVDAGDGLVVVEAMKMENELRAAGPGVIASVAVSAGDTVERDEVLVRFEEPAV
ncbi:MAG: biotin/lipoyl-containing protein [Gemmatimonadota bacterium]|nr:biotin/lipoyl-containing protein [Gemmatimonadota bacterium]